MQLEQVLDAFPWESEEQRKGVHSFLKWYRDYVMTCLKGGDAYPKLENDTVLLVAFIAQKNHEAQEWWRETMAAQIGALQKQIRLLQEDLRAVHSAR